MLGRGRGRDHAEGAVKKDSDNAVSKILVVDDEDNFRQVVIKFLSKQGFEVVAASERKAGVGLAAEALPDLVVCDLNMPGMDGYEVLATLRRDARLADIPVIFLTGQAEPSQVRQGMNLGADDYLTKPVDLADLLRAVQVRLSRRETQRQRQEKQMERAMQLFGGIVHDLRDPLFVVLGYTNLLQRGAGEGASLEAPKQILDRMQQAVLRMQAIISETLFLARSRMQRLPFDPGPFDLREFCEQLVADHEESRRLRLECAASRCPVVADALRLRQALENLLSNALKYSDGPVVVSLADAGPNYLLEVRDQGIGIPPGDLVGMFEPFFRASNTAGKPGHGLGLSIVKSCIEQHGGSVRFASELNRGTTFSLELPRSPLSKAAAQTAVLEVDDRTKALANQSSETRPARAAISSGVLSGRTARLRGIIVDDDPLVRSVMRDLLDTASDLQITGEAGTVAQARLLAKQQGPDVVFLDVNLPDGSGFDLLPDLKQDASVVFVTSAEEYAVHAFDCEAVDYLLKPVSPERLHKALVRVQQRRAAKLAAAPASSRLDETFLVKTLTEKRFVKVGEIDPDYRLRRILVGVLAWDQEGGLLRKSLKQWQAELPDEQFIRVHRRAIVNLAWMERIEKLPSGRMQIHLPDTREPILVSLRLAPVLNRKLKALRG